VTGGGTGEKKSSERKIVCQPKALNGRLCGSHRMASKYQIGFAGSVGSNRAPLEDLLLARTGELGIDGAQIAFLDENEIGQADPKSPLVVAFFGYEGGY
jgi:hypothetical protein